MPEVAARQLRVGGVVPFTTIDYPGGLSAVVFVQGCPWRCTYCHNPHLQPRDGATGPAWSDLLDWLRGRAGLLDAVVFSGGEPTFDPALPEAMAQARALGLSIGLHSAGTSPRRLLDVLPLADWVGLDVKAPLHDTALYETVSGVPGSAQAARASVHAVLNAGIAYELRTTADPALLDDAALLGLADDLASRGVTHYALQVARSVDGMAPVGGGYPAPDTLGRLERLFARFSLRSASGG